MKSQSKPEPRDQNVVSAVKFMALTRLGRQIHAPLGLLSKQQFMAQNTGSIHSNNSSMLAAFYINSHISVNILIKN